MSRLITHTISGSLNEVVQRINDMSLASRVLQLIPHSLSATVVFRVDDYPSYTWLCEKLHLQPVSTKEYFK